VHSPAYLVAQDLTKQFPGTRAPSVDRASFTLERGSMLTLLGPSGCGKTTLLRMIAGLVTPDTGSLHVAGRAMTSVPLHQRNMGMVFQSYALFPHLSVARNIAFGLEVRGVDRATLKREVADMIALARLEGFEHRRVADLSGGQRQRVALARALAIRPDVLLLDEPLANLDVKLRDVMRTEIRSLQRRLGVTAIFVTHDQEEALSMADQVAVMSEGRIQQTGTPQDIYDRPKTRFVASFIGRGNFLDATWQSPGVASVEGIGKIGIPSSIAPWQGIRTFLLRPHHIQTGTPALCVGEIEEVVYTGERHTISVRVGPLVLSVECAARSGTTPIPGTEIPLFWHPEGLVLLDAEHP